MKADGPPPDKPVCELLVDVDLFRRTLSALRRGGISRHAEAVLSFSDGKLNVDIQGVTSAIRARGRWTGQVRIPVTMLSAIEGGLGKGELLLTVQGQALSFDDMTVGCVWDDSVRASIRFPQTSDIINKLRTFDRYTEDEIDRSGLGGIARDAYEERDKMIKRAAKALAPLGIEAEDVRDLVNRHVRGELGSQGEDQTRESS